MCWFIAWYNWRYKNDLDILKYNDIGVDKIEIFDEKNDETNVKWKYEDAFLGVFLFLKCIDKVL